MEPLGQALRSGVGHLAAQAVPLVSVHQLQRPAQVLQEVQGAQAAQEGRGRRLAVKQAVGVVYGLGACPGEQGIFKRG